MPYSALELKLMKSPRMLKKDFMNISPKLHLDRVKYPTNDIIIERGEGIPLSIVHPRLRGAVSLANAKQFRDSKQKCRGNYVM